MGCSCQFLDTYFSFIWDVLSTSMNNSNFNSALGIDWVLFPVLMHLVFLFNVCICSHAGVHLRESCLWDGAENIFSEHVSQNI